MADDDDDDDVAMDEGQEAATDATGAQVAAGGPITAVIPVRKGTRPISPEVRAVFAASMAKQKAKGGSDEVEGGLEPVEHDDLAQEAAAVVPGEPVAVAETAAQAAPVVAAPAALAPTLTPPIAAAPPAPSLDPEVMRLRADLQQERDKLQADLEAFTAASRQSDVAKLRDVYFDKGAPAVVDVIKQWMPGLEGEDLKREVADLIQDLAHQYLEAPLDETVKDRITNKRVRTGLKTWKQDQERAEEERQKQVLASQEEADRLRVKRILHQEVTKPEHATQFPWLVLEDNAGDLIWEVAQQEIKESGKQLTWQEAAKKANDWLQSKSSAFYEKRKALLSPPPQAAPGDKQRAQGDKQVQQVTRAAEKPKAPTPPPERTATREPLPEARLVSKKWTPESHRANTMSKFRGQLQALTAEDE
jgi:hypothetical protein